MCSNMYRKCLMRVNWISPIPSLIRLFGLVLNIRITKKRFKDIIITFTTYRHILTKEKHALLLEANNLFKDNNDVQPCFVDITCRLKGKWENELRQDNFVSSLKDLKEKLQVNCNFFFSHQLFHCFGFLLVSDFSHIFRSIHRSCSVKKGFLRNVATFQENTCARVSFFIKVASLRLSTLLKKRLWHRCFPVNFAKFLRAPSQQDTVRRLLLSFIFLDTGIF